MTTPLWVWLQPSKIPLVRTGPEQVISNSIAPERIRTSDLTVRSRVLYPAELPVRKMTSHDVRKPYFCQGISVAGALYI